MSHSPGPWKAITEKRRRGVPVTAMVSTGAGKLAICCGQSGSTDAECIAKAEGRSNA